MWRELPHPRAVNDDPANAVVSDNASELIVLCGSLYRMVDNIMLVSIVNYAKRLRHEFGEFLVGEGGTDFRPGFEWLEDRDIQPGVCLYFTDLECSRNPEKEPGFPMIWASWGNPPPAWNREPRGERIDIDAE